MPILLDYKYFGKNANLMRAFFEQYNVSTENDTKSMLNPLYRLQREVSYVWLQWHMEEARTAFVGSTAYQHSKCRASQRNGYKVKKNVFLKGVGRLSLLVPQVRKHAKAFHRILALSKVPAEFETFIIDLVLKGKSAEATRQILADHFAVTISKTAILDMLNRFEKEYVAWANRPLDDVYPYMFVDGKWYDVLENGEKHRKVVIFVLGMKADGTSEVLAFNLLDSESIENGMSILANVRERGARSVKLVTSDASFRTAAKAIWTNAEYQACVKHKLDNIMQNAQDKRRARFILAEAASILRSRSETYRRKQLTAFVDKWEMKEPKVVKNFIAGLDECFTYLSITQIECLRRKLRTSNPIERHIREVNRKLKDLGYFHSVARGKLWIYLIVRTIASMRQGKGGAMPCLRQDEAA